jgi:hypothetical protein
MFDASTYDLQPFTFLSTDAPAKQVCVLPLDLVVGNLSVRRPSNVSSAFPDFSQARKYVTTGVDRPRGLFLQREGSSEI